MSDMVPAHKNDSSDNSESFAFVENSKMSPNLSTTINPKPRENFQQTNTTKNQNSTLEKNVVQLSYYDPNINISAMLEAQISKTNISESQIISLCRKLYPIQQSLSNQFVSLYRSIFKYVNIMYSKDYNNKNSSDGIDGKYNEIIKEILRYAHLYHGELVSILRKILERPDVRDKLLKGNQKKKQSDNQNKKEKFNLLSTISLGSKFRTEKLASANADKISFDFSSKYQHDPSKVGGSSIKELENIKNISKTNRNLKKCSICQKQLDGSIVKCQQCDQKFHFSCYTRKSNCIFCQIRNINPFCYQQDELFLGFLKKNIRRHLIEFNYCKDSSQTLLTEFFDQKQKKNKSGIIEVRSLRIKQKYDQNSSYITLFPDACKVFLNKQSLKEFMPLHQQCSLKYRQDQIVQFPSISLKKGVNEIQICERFNNKTSHDQQRIESQNHLIGIYLIKQSLEPRQLIQKCRNLSFENSLTLLKQSLLIDSDEICNIDRNGKVEQSEIACQTQKISLMCPLTLIKMEYPGRTIFCTHFTCFDIFNFLLLNSQALIPKWQCPICKAPAYKFKIDPIVSSILKLLSHSDLYPRQKKSRWVQVIFTKQMKFWAVDQEGCFGQQVSVYDLTIEEQAKNQTEERYKRKQSPLVNFTENNTEQLIENDALDQERQQVQMSEDQQKQEIEKEEKNPEIANLQFEPALDEFEILQAQENQQEQREANLLSLALESEKAHNSHSLSEQSQLLIEQLIKKKEVEYQLNQEANVSSKPEVVNKKIIEPMGPVINQNIFEILNEPNSAVREKNRNFMATLQSIDGLQAGYEKSDKNKKRRTNKGIKLQDKKQSFKPDTKKKSEIPQDADIVQLSD